MNIGYLASTIIAGIMLISLVTLNLRVSQNSGEQTLYQAAKTQADMLSDYFTHDLRSMGYRIAGQSPILEADENRIRYLVHFEGDENPTEISWTFAPDSTTSYSNPDIRPLYRSQNGDEMQVGVGVTRFDLEYLDQNRDVLDPATFSDPAQIERIRQIRLNLVVESTQGYGPDRYGRSFWTGEIRPHNLH